MSAVAGVGAPGLRLACCVHHIYCPDGRSKSIAQVSVTTDVCELAQQPSDVRSSLQTEGSLLHGMWRITMDSRRCLQIGCCLSRDGWGCPGMEQKHACWHVSNNLCCLSGTSGLSSSVTQEVGTLVSALLVQMDDITWENVRTVSRGFTAIPRSDAHTFMRRVLGLAYCSCSGDEVQIMGLAAGTDLILMAKEGITFFDNNEAAWSTAWRSGVGADFDIVRRAVDAKMTQYMREGTWVEFGRRLVKDEEGIYIAIHDDHITCEIDDYARHVMDQVHSRLLQQAAGQPVDPVPPPYPARPRKVVSIMEDALPTPELLADLLWELRGGMDYV